MPNIRSLTLFAAASVAALACQQQAPTVETAVVRRVESPALGLALASLPDAFEEVSSDGEAWRFKAPGDGGDGSLVVTAAPERSGSINLVDEVKARKEWFETTEGATYYGNRELGGPIGTIYTARGAYAGAEGDVEETWAYAIHPGQYRLLSIQYTYPPGESGTRVEQLLEFLGEIEALTPASAES